MTAVEPQQPRLALAAMGGTLSMAARPGEAGIVPMVDACAWAERLPTLTQLAPVQLQTLCLLPSASLGFDQVMTALTWAQGQVRGGATGVVITQGTDTLEETAYLLSLLWDHAVPLVLTGAMRGADDPCADGPANLIAAAQVALAANSRDRGVLVVMNAQVHAASAVRKAHTLALDAFTSPEGGPLGYLEHGKVCYQFPAAALPAGLRLQRLGQRVALFEASLGEGPEWIEHACRSGYEGIVIAGFGAGHVAACWAPWLERAARQMPVIVASRTGAGSTASNTYGFAGGEIDLRRRGIHMAGHLCPRKCRLLLWALIGAGALEQLPLRLVAGRGPGLSSGATANPAHSSSSSCAG
ncbi:asparaginase [Pseudomonas sp. RIT-PI-S]|uniref:asparaginase n=1 Tax=Pseudomonas sp. RIT-PI-S TaxID=3035295 RepID=UPI0021D8983E|nr:asparaginase [Pseudomonas sp. RIT-PI-S]